MRRPKKLHIGCGDNYFSDYLNVDLYAEKVDLREDIRVVDFPDRKFKKILIVHTLEHIDRGAGILLLKKCHKWLWPKGGYLQIEMPDREKCEALMSLRTDSTVPTTTQFVKRMRYDGAKALWGGRSRNKKEWKTWIQSWVDRGCRPDDYPPPEFDLPGEAHLCVWGGLELKEVLEGIGFKTSLENPYFHGRRSHRDTQWRAYKQ